MGNNLQQPITQVTKKLVNAGSTNIHSITATNTNAAIRYLQLHNKATAPAGGDVPVLSFPIPAGTATDPGVVTFTEDDFGREGLNFALGLGWAISTTLATFTDSATSTDHIVVVTHA